MFLRPNYNLKNIYDIDFVKLKEAGIKCIMFDLDSTVMVSKSANFLPETVEWFNSFMKDFEVAIISNNKKSIFVPVFVVLLNLIISNFGYPFIVKYLYVVSGAISGIYVLVLIVMIIVTLIKTNTKTKRKNKQRY